MTEKARRSFIQSTMGLGATALTTLAVGTQANKRGAKFLKRRPDVETQCAKTVGG